MANVYKNIQAKVTSAGSFDDMYTAPDETTSIVKTIKLYKNYFHEFLNEPELFAKFTTLLARRIFTFQF